jgi:DNA-binding response OmpR family regulator
MMPETQEQGRILPSRPARILLVEDDTNLAFAEQRILEKAGHIVKLAATGGDALAELPTFRPEIVLLDIDLPDIMGWDVCEQITGQCDAGVIFLTGHGLDDERLKGLRLGADDYITKPFRADTVLNTVAVYTRRIDRMRDWKGNSDRNIGDGAKMIHSSHTLERDGKSVPLTALEFKLLLFLADGAGTLLSRGQILEHVWNDTSGIETRVVDVHIVAIRKKIAEIEANLKITPVRSVGYRYDIAPPG